MKFKAIWVNRQATSAEVACVTKVDTAESWVKKRFLLFPVTCKLPGKDANCIDETRWLCMARWIDVRRLCEQKVPYWFDEPDAPKLVPLLDVSRRNYWIPEMPPMPGKSFKLETDTDARLKAEAELDAAGVQCTKQGV